MIARRYTADEVDSMRVALLVSSRISDAQVLEETLRTYIIAGVDPEELLERAHQPPAAVTLDAA